MDSTNTPKNSKVIRFGKFRYLAAGGILVLILAMCFLPVGGGQNLFTALEDKLSQTLEIFSVRSAGAPTEEDAAIAELQACMKLYNNEDYAAAVPAFESYVAKFSSSDNIDEAKLYLSVSYIYNNQAANATSILKQLAENKDFMMQEDAQWFLGISYVFLRDMDMAKASFEQLKDSEEYGERATTMLEAKESPQGDNVVFK
jgi:TolA-binding protein